ncbi:hypothetical protein PsYK624_071620 [Phanerochaete sordida]|uniref:Uncharacterized protein n=1 Tax=Phanerochaete sordida TaxID=48140 RepID=A0A9P3LDX0_9APHY|nr:hypothetical protein PsYK624_071620 [Phanerochaete sordida]
MSGATQRFHVRSLTPQALRVAFQSYFWSYGAIYTVTLISRRDIRCADEAMDLVIMTAFIVNDAHRRHNPLANHEL